jgi:hypothetical protein
MPSNAFIVLTHPLACLSLCITVPADILPGQGLYPVYHNVWLNETDLNQLNETYPDQLNQTAQAWRAINCNSRNYGVANVTYGLARRPCRYGTGSSLI